MTKTRITRFEFHARSDCVSADFFFKTHRVRDNHSHSFDRVRAFCANRVNFFDNVFINNVFVNNVFVNNVFIDNVFIDNVFINNVIVIDNVIVDDVFVVDNKIWLFRNRFLWRNKRREKFFNFLSSQTNLIWNCAFENCENLIDSFFCLKNDSISSTLYF